MQFKIVCQVTSGYDDMLFSLGVYPRAKFYLINIFFNT